MGSTFSSGNNAFCYLPRSLYHGGDIVEGFICLNCLSPFPCVQVLLRVEAYEKTSWTEKHSRTVTTSGPNGTTSSHTEYDYYHRSATHDLFKVAIPMYMYPQMCLPGQYQFPFSFVLPVNLPGSFSWSSSSHYDTRGHECQNTRAKICYKVKSECVVPGMLKPNIRSKQHIVVFQRLLKPPTSILANKSKEIKTCCCAGKGVVHLTAQIEKDSYAPGETAGIILQVDNQSEIEFKEIRVYCSLHVTLRAGGSTQEFKEKMPETCFPGILKFQTQMGDQARHLRMQLPPSMLSTTYGALIHCRYKLVIRCKAPMFTTDAELKVPLTIYCPPPPVMIVQAPAYWHPTVTGQVVQVNLPAAPPVAPGVQQMGVPAPQQQQQYDPKQQQQQQQYPQQQQQQYAPQPGQPQQYPQQQQYAQQPQQYPQQQQQQQQYAQQPLYAGK